LLSSLLLLLLDSTFLAESETTLGGTVLSGSRIEPDATLGGTVFSGSELLMIGKTGDRAAEAVGCSLELGRAKYDSLATAGRFISTSSSLIECLRILMYSVSAC
jgi:hypothetical protein